MTIRNRRFSSKWLHTALLTVMLIAGPGLYVWERMSSYEQAERVRVSLGSIQAGRWLWDYADNTVTMEPPLFGLMYGEDKINPKVTTSTLPFDEFIALLFTSDDRKNIKDVILSNKNNRGKAFQMRVDMKIPNDKEGDTIPMRLGGMVSTDGKFMAGIAMREDWWGKMMNATIISSANSSYDQED